MRRIARLLTFTLLASVSACKKTDSLTGQPIDSNHYSRADFRAKCFKVPDQNDLITYKAMLKLDEQAALDYDYRQQIKMSPAGSCSVLNPDGSIKAQPNPAPTSSNNQTGWVENARANDMSHYGDALPGGKHHH